MILYQFNCDRRHNFEAWFKDGDTCDRQLKRKALECPVCGSVKIAKALMAPRIGKSNKGRGIEAIEAPAATPSPAGVPAPATAASAPPAVEKMAVMPKELRKALLEVRKQIETNCDYVGDKFAEEARKIHEGDAEARSIYGEATEEEHRDLAEDGIEVARIPWVPRGDA